MRKLPGIRTKRRRDGSVYYQIRIKGQDKHLGTAIGAARRKAALLLKSAYADEVSDGQPPRFVASLCERWEAEHSDFPKPWLTRAWAKYAGPTAMHELTVDHFDGFVSWLKKGYHVQAIQHAHGHTPERSARSFASNSIRDRVGHAMRICQWAVDRGWILRAPRRPRLPAPTRRPRDVEPGRLARAFEKLPARAGRLLRFCLEVGARSVEVRLLQWEQVDLPARMARLPDHKTGLRTGRERVLFLTDQAIQAIPPRQPDSPWVFPSRLGGPYSASGLRSILRCHARGITPSQMRPTFAQHAIDTGVSVDDLAGLLGHADSRTTRFYAEVKSARLARAAAGLTSPLHGTPQSGPSDSAAAISRAGPSKARQERSARARRRRA